MSLAGNYNTDISHQSITTFHQLKLSSGDYLRALEKLNFLQPTPIQILSIPLGCTNKNVIAQAKAGTGKTLAFSSIFIEKLIQMREQITQDSSPLVLIILPTRELAIQVFEFIQSLLSAIKSVNPTLLPHVNSGIFIGGLPLQDDRRNLKIQKVKIVIGTIGRIVALIKENSLSLSSINTFIMDEADKLMGQKDFYKHITYIFDTLNKQALNNQTIQLKEDPQTENVDETNQQNKEKDEKETAFDIMQRRKKNMIFPVQYLAYSATYPEDLKQKIEKLMETSQFIDAIQLQNAGCDGSNQDDDQHNENKDLNLDNIVQFRVDVKQQGNLSITKQKIAAMINLLKDIKFNQVIIFYNDKIKGENIFSELKAQNYTAIFIHGDQSQADRIKIMNQIRRNKTQIIISTDLLSRGIDINTIDLVINYDMPSTVETYYHRIGRTGRYGRYGISVLLVQPNEENFIQSNIIHFCRLQNLPSDFNEINQKLEQKQISLQSAGETGVSGNSSNNQNQPNQTINSSESKNANKKSKAQQQAPPKYHHEFTQGIILEAVDINERYYDESNFKYFEEEEFSPIVFNGQTELSGSMFSEEDPDLDDEDEDEAEEISDSEEEEDEEEVEVNSIENNAESLEIDGKLKKKGIQDCKIGRKKHKCLDKSEWGFLSCQVCYEFLVESEKYLNRKFEILQYFKIKTNVSSDNRDIISEVKDQQ